jgi:hypothetical protein
VAAFAEVEKGLAVLERRQLDDATTPGCSTRALSPPQGWPATATRNPSPSKKTIALSPSIGRAPIAFRDPPSSIPIARPGASQPSSDTPRACSRHRPEISDIFG